MKKKGLLLISIIILSGCHFSQGMYNDIKTGLFYSYSGFSVKEILLLNGYNEVLASNQIPEGSILILYLKDIKHYTVEDDKVYLGCRIEITNPDGEEILLVEDVYENNDGIPVNKMKNQAFQVRMSEPVMAGETYSINYFITDKKNKDNTINASVTVDIIPNEAIIHCESNELSVDNIFFAEKKGQLPQPKVKENTSAAFVFKDLDGFTLENGKVFPGCKVTIFDKNDKVLFLEEDLFKEMPQDGLNPQDVQTITAAVKYNKPLTAGNMYHVRTFIFDKKNEGAYIDAYMDIQVIK